MDFMLLAETLRIFLAPTLPYLLTAAGKASEEAGKKVGGAAVDKAKEVWGKLRPAVEAKPAALEAARDAARAADDTDAQTVWKVQLKKILEGDPALARQLECLLPPRYQAQVLGSGAIAQGPGAVAAGERGVAVGGDVRGSVILTGDEALSSGPKRGFEFDDTDDWD